MRHIIWYLRSAFCKHDFKIEETHVKETWRQGDVVSATCKNCGWHRRYWKFM